MARILSSITHRTTLSIICSASLVFSLSKADESQTNSSYDSIAASNNSEQTIPLPDIYTPQAKPKRINAIIITGNYIVSNETIRAQVPFKEGDLLKSYKLPELIKSLYSLKSGDETKIGGYFTAIDIKGEDIDADTINIHIIVQEKKHIESINFVGNNHLKESDIENKLHLSEIKALDPQELTIIADNIKKLYAEKDYHDAQITSDYKDVDQFHIAVTFTIDEGSATYIKRVLFEGNKTFTSKRLRSFLVTKEDWLLGFLQKAGSYHPEALQYDRRMLEDFYQSNGFLTARVTDVNIEVNPKINGFVITFVIDEGELYTIDKVSAQGNNIISEEEILMRIPIQAGQLYSKEQVRFALEGIRIMWGEFGYIDADVTPSIQADREKKTVSIKFLSDLGTKKSVNRIFITGNNKTRDSIILKIAMALTGRLIELMMIILILNLLLKKEKQEASQEASALAVMIRKAI